MGVPIVETGARFASPVRYGDEVRIETTVSEVREKTFRVEHEVSVGGRRCATGFEVRAWVAQPESPGGRCSRPGPFRQASPRPRGREREIDAVAWLGRRASDGRLAGAFLTVHTPRYCTLEAAIEGKLASEVFRPVRDGLVAQGDVVARGEARRDA